MPNANLIFSCQVERFANQTGGPIAFFEWPKTYPGRFTVEDWSQQATQTAALQAPAAANQLPIDPAPIKRLSLVNP
jgi:hypothetical protein